MPELQAQLFSKKLQKRKKSYLTAFVHKMVNRDNILVLRRNLMGY